MEITRLIQVRGTLSYQPRTSASPANQHVVTGLLTLREFHSKKDSNIHQWEIAFVDQELGVDSAIALPWQSSGWRIVRNRATRGKNTRNSGRCIVIEFDFPAPVCQIAISIRPNPHGSQHGKAFATLLTSAMANIL
jgi:hypothetical protein